MNSKKKGKQPNKKITKAHMGRQFKLPNTYRKRCSFLLVINSKLINLRQINNEVSSFKYQYDKAKEK